MIKKVYSPMTEEEKIHFNESYIARKEFINAAKALFAGHIDLLNTWENLSHSDNSETSVDCPFESSFDEWVWEYAKWIDNLEQKFVPKVEYFNPTVTVKDLKQILSVLEDDTQIVISDKKNNWWINIKEVELPSEGIFTLVLHPTNDFDARQF